MKKITKHSNGGKKELNTHQSPEKKVINEELSEEQLIEQLIGIKDFDTTKVYLF